jgi:multiple sugar transport system substrate-binding protein
MKRCISIVVALVLTLTGCTSSGSSADGKNITLVMWAGWTDRDFNALRSILNGYEKSHPGIKVRAVPDQGDVNKVVQAISAGEGPDLATGWAPEDMGKLCASGGLVDIGRYEARDQLTPDLFPPAARAVLSFKGRHCALPYLSDAEGLYYNTDMLRAAGFSAPPTTVSQLVVMAKKLTTYEPDGSIKVAGFVPLLGFEEQYASALAGWFGAKFFDSSGHADLATDPGWNAFFTFQKQAIANMGGYAKVAKFVAGLGQEFSADNPFETAHIAMMTDGEWRIGNVEREHPEVHFDTSALPAPDYDRGLAGASRLPVTWLAVARGSKHPEQAYELARYLTTNTGVLVRFANICVNVPTTTAALASPQLHLGAKFAPFLAAFANPRSSIPPILAGGPVYFDPINAFIEKWQAGRISDLHSALLALDKQIDAFVAQS